MRDISLDDKPGAAPVHTFLMYGDSRTGKTTFSATLPRPLILADVTEGGYTSIKTMDRATWFEPEYAPIIKGIENMNDIAASLPEIKALIAAHRVKSIVFDAFSFYTDFFLAKLVEAQAKPDMRQAYGTLGQHLRKIRTDLHSLGVNVVWCCLAKHPDADDPKGRPMIPGQQSDKFAAGVNFLFHSRLEQKREGGKVVSEEYQLRTRQFGSYIVGNREGIYADNLPDPFVGNYADLITALGFDVEAIRKAMPKPGAVAPVATTVAKPPIAALNKGSTPTVITMAPKAGNNQAPSRAVK